VPKKRTKIGRYSPVIGEFPVIGDICGVITLRLAIAWSSPIVVGR
jgi:hypothetical protein